MENSNVWTKLAAFQAKVPSIKKNAVNPHFKNKYADLAEIMQTIRPILSEVGLLMIQRIESDSLCTVIMCPESQTQESACLPIPQGLNPQQLGSYLTYIRRYSLAALLCLDTDDDDDANQAQTAKQAQTKQAPKDDKIEVSFEEIALLISTGLAFDMKPSPKEDGIGFIIVQHEGKTKYAKGQINDQRFQDLNKIRHDIKKAGLQ
jgi:hypothetical protein